MSPPGEIPKHPIVLRPDALGQALSEAAKPCQDEACLNEKVEAGVALLGAGNTPGAQDLFRNMEECASANKNIRYELLARGLIALSEGHILAAQENFRSIYDHPYAQRLLQVISRYDDQEVSLQTLHLLSNLVEEEKADHPGQALLKDLQSFTEEALKLFSTEKNLSLKIVFERLEMDPSKNFKGLTEALSQVGNGLGGAILGTAELKNHARGQALFSLLETRLLPEKRMGTAYLIAKMYQKDPEFGDRARQYILRFEGIVKDPRWVTTDFLDQGASYFAVSLASLALARYASRGVWALLTRNNASLSWGRRLLGVGLSLSASTATYFVAEKALLGLSGFDGKILPESGSELARELGADMIVMGLSNAMGGVFTWSTERIFRPISSRLPRGLRYLGYVARSPLRLAAWGLTAGAHATVLYGTHRFEDNFGMIDRFRKGKPLRWLPQEWVNTEYNGLDVLRAQNLLSQYLSESSRQIEDIKGDEIYHQIHDMKRWIRSLNGKQSPEQEEQLLGIFWIARACGKLNESAQEHLLKWMKEGRYERINQYLTFHQIPLLVAPEAKLFVPQLAPSSLTPPPQ